MNEIASLKEYISKNDMKKNEEYMNMKNQVESLEDERKRLINKVNEYTNREAIWKVKVCRLTQYSMCIDFFTYRTFCEPNQKFARASTGLAYSESNMLFEIMSLDKWVMQHRLRVLFLNEPCRQKSYRTFGSVRKNSMRKLYGSFELEF
jgi:hypothetical protein